MSNTKTRTIVTPADLFLAALALVSAAGADAQQRLQIDHSSGREIVNEWDFGFREIAAIDHQKGLIYVVDASEPLGVMAFSLDDGALVGVYGGTEGEGPGELQHMVAVAAASDGVLVSDHARVNHWSLAGDLAGVWRPGPSIPSICNLMDEPTVPLQGGVLRRNADGTDVVLGTVKDRNIVVGENMSAAIAAARLVMASHMACIGDVAYVLDEHLTGYSLDGRTFAVPIPAELAERSQQIREAVRNSQGGGFRYPYTGLFDDGNGNLVVTLWPSDVAGAVIAPETGCHSILLDTEPQRASRRLAGIYRDSVVVFGNQTDVQMIDGKRTTVSYAGEAFMIALRPLRPAGGEPCPAP